MSTAQYPKKLYRLLMYLKVANVFFHCFSKQTNLVLKRCRAASLQQELILALMVFWFDRMQYINN